jgi:LysM repeat protein
MTRDTKIGLLVGLAFVIVIGILISDHISSSTEPPEAPLGGAGNGVRQAVGSPGASGEAAPVSVVTPVVTPQQPVATQSELTNPAPAVQIVKIGGPVSPVQQQAPLAAAASGDPAKAQANDASATATNVAPANPGKNNDATQNDPPVVTLVANPPTATDSELTKVAEAHGEPLVSADGSNPPAGSAQAYVAQPGDSLSKIAARFMGSGSKTNRDLIVKANPSLAANENMIIAGKTYQIPAAGKAAAKVPAAPASVDQATTPVDDTSAKTASATDGKPSKAEADAGYVYTVQPGDNLTKIARDEVGDVHAIAAIQELNPDKLKGPNHDIVIAGSKIRLPGKPLARAE